ncbi:DUF4303 domain-containing protein [Actinomadura sp. KC345]|uniref:DUF4303 domain-containing protein n=1 Tax=Actinomadura sp. KC345 TaxID=2530371 RepID=UPI00104E5BB8|nr:DUF4303 domain-containing protein [Actinomadura sp. KC345]TDC55318.1 DUF4303 domain-containing protein [Actinomadura sp. KC345]
MSAEELVPGLVAAARAAFEQVRQRHPDETFYCYALLTNELAQYVAPTCMSEEGLTRVAREYAERSGAPLEQEAGELRWSAADSPHHLLGDEHFDRVTDALYGRDDPWELDGDAVNAEVDARFEAFFRALVLLDEEGFFGHGAERERVVVNVLEGDQSDRSILANAQRLNPPAALERLAADLAVPEPIGDPSTLGPAGAYQVTGLAYAGRAGLLVACGSGGELYAWDVDGRREVLSTAHDTAYWETAISADGRVLLLNDRKSVRRAELPGGAAQDMGMGKVWCMDLSRDGATVFTGGDGGVRAYAVGTGQALWRHGRSTSGLRLSDDGTLLTLSTSGRVRAVELLDAADGTPHGEPVRFPQGADPRLAWSPDDRILAVGESRLIRLWRRHEDGVTDGVTLGPPPSGESGVVDEIADMAFSPDGTLLAAAHTGGDVHVWEVAGGRHLHRLRGWQEAMCAVTFLDDRRLAAAGRDVDSGPPVYVWSLPSQRR